MVSRSGASVRQTRSSARQRHHEFLYDRSAHSGVARVCRDRHGDAGRRRTDSGRAGAHAALFVFGEMVSAVYLIHLPNGFFMNWEGQLKNGNEGFEFHILALAILAAVI